MKWAPTKTHVYNNQSITKDKSKIVCDPKVKTWKKNCMDNSCQVSPLRKDRDYMEVTPQLNTFFLLFHFVIQQEVTLTPSSPSLLLIFCEPCNAKPNIGKQEKE